MNQFIKWGSLSCLFITGYLFFTQIGILDPLVEYKTLIRLTFYASCLLCLYLFIYYEPSYKVNRSITWLKYKEYIKIEITESAHNKIKKSVGSLPAETIGFLFGKADTYTITDFVPYFDSRYDRKQVTYNYDKLKEIIYEKQKKNLVYLGTIHSHPIDEDFIKVESKIHSKPQKAELSDEDIQVSFEVISDMRKGEFGSSYHNMEFIIDGIAFSSVDNGGVFRLFFHRVSHTKKVSYYLPYEIV